MRLKNSLLGIILIVLLISGCGVYSFGGDTIDYNKTKTISIQTIYNDSGNGPPGLSQNFTEKLKDFFQRNTKLTLVQSEGDLQIEGSIVGYQTSLVGASAASSSFDTDDATQESLTIRLKVKFVNTTDDTFDFDKNFSWHEEYDPTQTDFNTVENDLIELIADKIVNDIFNQSVANW